MDQCMQYTRKPEVWCHAMILKCSMRGYIMRPRRVYVTTHVTYKSTTKNRRQSLVLRDAPSVRLSSAALTLNRNPMERTS